MKNLQWVALLVRIPVVDNVTVHAVILVMGDAMAVVILLAGGTAQALVIESVIQIVKELPEAKVIIPIATAEEAILILLPVRLKDAMDAQEDVKTIVQDVREVVKTIVVTHVIIIVKAHVNGLVKAHATIAV